jgi:hypothetical protein
VLADVTGSAILIWRFRSDRLAALMIAVIAAAEAWHTAPKRQSPC